MNYRHAYHAGNFADIFKHFVLTRIVEYLKHKDKAFRVIDTHAGIGHYDLRSEDARRTGEWQGGAGRLLSSDIPKQIGSLFSPLLDSIRVLNETREGLAYPGSPLLVRHLLRRQDRLTAIELHPADAKTLKTLFAGDFQTRVLELDGWLALGAHVPPKERRGLVLVDPPFELTDEFARMIDGLAKAHRRWPDGIYALWYPLKDRTAVARYRSGLAATGIPRLLDISFSIRAPSPEQRLDGCAITVVNPPFTLAAELETALPWLSELLAEGPGHGFAIRTIAGERVSP